MVVVPCGTCTACQQRKISEWCTRIEHSVKFNKTSWFITLTYSDKFHPKNNSLNKEDFQKFMKSLRHKIDSKIKYYACGEYGERTARPHYHAIIINTALTKEEMHYLCLKAWKKGIVHIGEANGKTIRYISGYVQKKQSYPQGVLKPFSLISNGIGEEYVDLNKDWHKKDFKHRLHVIQENGIKKSIPRYYRKKMYSKMQNQIVGKKLQKAAEEYAKEENYNAQLELDRKIRYKERIEKQRSKNQKI